MDFLLHIGHWSANVRRVCLMLRGDEVITDDRVRSYYVQLARRLILHRSRRFNQTGYDIYEREQLTMRNKRGEGKHRAHGIRNEKNLQDYILL